MFCGAEIRLHWFEFEDEMKVNANGIEVRFYVYQNRLKTTLLLILNTTKCMSN